MSGKTLKYDAESQAAIRVENASIQATVAKPEDSNGILINEDGVYIRGPISIMTPLEKIRYAGFWKEQSAWMQMFPSTTAFPIPRLILSPPLTGIKNMVEAVAFLKGLLM